MSDIDAILLPADYGVVRGTLYQSGALPDLFARCMTLGVSLCIDLEGGLDPVGTPASDGYLYVWWPIDDAPRLPMLAHLAEVARLAVTHLLIGGNVLVHCGQGFNRASLVNGQIQHMLQPDLPGLAIVDRIRSRRAGALSNETFTAYLMGLGPH